MTVDNDPNSRYIKEIILPVVETAYTSTLKVIDHIDSAQDAGDISFASYEFFVRDYARLLVTIEQLAHDKADLRAELAARVLLTKLTNLLTLNKNVRALQEVDREMIAAVIENVRSLEIMRDSLRLLSSKALDMLREALKDV